MAEISAKAVKDLRDQTGAGMMDCKRALAESGGDVKKAVAVLRERGLAKAGKREGRATSEGVIAIALEGGSGGMCELGCETDFVARTEEFAGLANALATAVALDPGLATVDALLDASVEAEKVRDRLTAAVAKLGENVEVKRVAHLSAEGAGLVGGYVHAGGKLGVLIALRTGRTGPEAEALAKDLAMHIAAADPTPVAVDAAGIPADAIAAEREIFVKQAKQSGKPEAVIEKIVEGRVRKFMKEVCLLDQTFVKDPDRSVGDLLRDFAGADGGEVTVAAFRRFRLGEASEG